MPDLSQITALIKTFERPDVCTQAVAALRRHCRGLGGIIVADDGRDTTWIHGLRSAVAGRNPDPFDDLRLDYLRLPYDVGLAAGRNALVRACKTEYALILDDDMLVNESIDLRAMLRVLESTGAFAVSAEKHTPQGSRNTGSVFRMDGSTLHMERATEVGQVGGTRFVMTDFIPNFILAKTSMLRAVKWDEQFKCGGEHFDWCFQVLDLMGAFGVRLHPFALCYDMCFLDTGERPAGYGEKRRKEGKRDSSAWRRKWGVKEVRRWQDGVAGKVDYSEVAV